MQTFIIRVKPGHVMDEVRPDGDEFVVRVKPAAQDGKANKRVINLMAEYLKVKPRQVVIIKGEKSRVKTIGVTD